MKAETNFLLLTQVRRFIEALQAISCSTLSTGLFAGVYLTKAFSGNFRSSALAQVGVAVAALLGAAVVIQAARRYRAELPSRAWFAVGVGLCAGFLAGYRLGNSCWYRLTVNYYNWQDMSSYINIDPEADKGQSFMDAGTIYFKDGAFVRRDQAVSFHNGLTYCVAPIARAGVMSTGVNNDFWAVGADCCGQRGEDFSCDDSQSPLARSGLRLLDDTRRSMYLLAVQEWAATSGHPVQHPLFFHWVKDPVHTVDHIYQSAWDGFWMHVSVFFGVSLLVWSIYFYLLPKGRWT